jgi:hypothetical protein
MMLGKCFWWAWLWIITDGLKPPLLFIVLLFQVILPLYCFYLIILYAVLP